MAVGNAEYHAGREPVNMSLVGQGLIQNRSAQSRSFGFLDGFV